jgi:ribonuclease BN (tRNA processing enzyme)
VQPDEGAPRTTLTFLGTGPAIPEPGNDTASYLINGHVQVDCGWCATPRMMALGLDPLAVDLLIFTHLHQDHYMGLVHLLYHRCMRGRRADGSYAPLTIAGPAEDVWRVVELAWQFIQAERFFPQAPRPKVVPLVPGVAWEVGELRLQAAAALHPVPALCLRLADLRTGAQLGLSGDTAYDPALAAFFRGVSILVHEASHGARTVPRERNYALHSGAVEAARVARDAGARQLYLVHAAPADWPLALEAARREFAATEVAPLGRTVVVEGGRSA